MFTCPICQKVLSSRHNSIIAEHIWRHIRDLVPDPKERITLRRAMVPSDQCPECGWEPRNPKLHRGAEVGGHRAHEHGYKTIDAALAVYNERRKAAGG